MGFLSKVHQILKLVHFYDTVTGIKLNFDVYCRDSLYPILGGYAATSSKMIGGKLKIKIIYQMFCAD
jgi:hypothetical protein